MAKGAGESTEKVVRDIRRKPEFSRFRGGGGNRTRVRLASWKHHSPIPRVRPWPLLTACVRPADRPKPHKPLIYLRFLELGSAGFEPEGRGGAAKGCESRSVESLPARHLSDSVQRIGESDAARFPKHLPGLRRDDKRVVESVRGHGNPARTSRSRSSRRPQAPGNRPCQRRPRPLCSRGSRAGPPERGRAPFRVDPSPRSDSPASRARGSRLDLLRVPARKAPRLGRGRPVM